MAERKDPKPDIFEDLSDIDWGSALDEWESSLGEASLGATAPVSAALPGAKETPDEVTAPRNLSENLLAAARRQYQAPLDVPINEGMPSEDPTRPRVAAVPEGAASAEALVDSDEYEDVDPDEVPASVRSLHVPIARVFDPNEETVVRTNAEMDRELQVAVGELQKLRREARNTRNASLDLGPTPFPADAVFDPPIPDEAKRQEMLARVDWLSAEARLARDKRVGGRMLAETAEMAALAGDRSTARKLAQSSIEATNFPLAHTLLRGLTGYDEPLRALSLLESQARAALVTPAALHVELLGYELCRRLGDEHGAIARLSDAETLSPTDVRAPLSRASRALAFGVAEPQYGDAAEDLDRVLIDQAVRTLSRLRGWTDQDAGGEWMPADSLREARAMSERGDGPATGASLFSLGQEPAFAFAAAWLGWAFRQGSAPSDSEDGSAHRQRLCTRARLRDAVERRPAELGSELDEKAIPEEDRLVLRSLSGNIAPEDHAAVLALGDVDRTRAMATAIAGTMATPAANDGAHALALTLVAGTAAERHAMAWVRAVCMQDALSASRLPCEGGEPHARFATWARLEAEARQGRYRLFADTAEAVAHDTANSALLAVAGVFAEGDDTEGAMRRYGRLVARPGCRTFAARALGTCDPHFDLAVELAQLGADHEDAEVGAMLMLEASCRSEALDPSTRMELLGRAASQSADPFVARMHCEALARRSGQPEALPSLLESFLPLATDPFERALAEVRAALSQDRDADAPPSLLSMMQELPDQPSLRIRFASLSETLPVPAPTLCNWAIGLHGVHHSVCAVELAMRAHASKKAPDSAPTDGSPAPVDTFVRRADALIAWDNAPHLPEEERAGQDWLTLEPGSAERTFAYASHIGDTALAARAAALVLDGLPTRVACFRAAHASTSPSVSLSDWGRSQVRLLDALETPDDPIRFAAACIAGYVLFATGAPLADVRALASLALSAAVPPSKVAQALGLAAARLASDAADLLRLGSLVIEPAVTRLDEAMGAYDRFLSYDKLGNYESGRDCLQKGRELSSDSFALADAWCSLYMQAGMSEPLAEGLEALAQTCSAREHELSAWLLSAECWLSLDSPKRAEMALRRVIDLDLSYRDAFQKLCSLYRQSRDHRALADLLQRRLSSPETGDELVAMELERGRALAWIDELDDARACLERALDREPESASTLVELADVCFRLEDYPAAEKHWLGLARLSTSAEAQRDAYLRLGQLYADHLGQLDRAERAFLEVLARTPNDTGTKRMLVEVYRRSSNPERAVEVQLERIDQSQSPAERRERLLELASIHEETAGEVRKAERTLEQARRELPSDSVVLRHMVEFYTRHNHASAIAIALDGAASDARRAIAQGKLDAEWFDLLATAYELRGRAEAARVVRAAVSALEGTPSRLVGADAAAGDTGHDDLLAPPEIGPAVRSLLARTGAALEQAVFVDSAKISTLPLPASAVKVTGEVMRVALAMQIPAPSVVTSKEARHACIPIPGNPARLLVGEELLADSRGEIRLFLIVRAMKLLSSHLSAVASLSPSECEQVVADWLHACNPAYNPTEEKSGTGPYGHALAAAIGPVRDATTEILALEVAGMLQGNAPRLAELAREWANRVAFLATGSPSVALDALALIDPEGTRARSATERQSWLATHPEARALLKFAVSEACANVRTKLGV